MLKRSFKRTKLFIFAACALAIGAFGEELEIGIVDTFQTQLPVTLWDKATLPRSVLLLRSTKPSHIPSINRLRVVIALSQSRPSLELDDSSQISAARLNLLYNHGMLDASEALAQLMPWGSRVVREQVEKISLLSTRPEHYCEQLLGNQFIESEQGFKIFCLARANQWPEAIDLFELTREEIVASRREVLQRFLEIDAQHNPVLNEPWQELPNPLDFVLDEAFGRPRGNAALPPSYIYFSREIGSNPIDELIYTEDLTRLGSLPANVLFASYRKFTSKESSPTLDRAKSVQKIIKIDIKSLPNDFDKLISKSIELFSDANLLEPFAAQMAPFLSKLDLVKVENKSTRNHLMRLAILGGWSRAQWVQFIARDDYPMSLAFSLRHPDAPSPSMLNAHLPTKVSRIVNAAFAENSEDKTTALPLGSDILDALNSLDNLSNLPEEKTIEAFDILKKSGQDKLAREIAINLLFAGDAI